MAGGIFNLLKTADYNVEYVQEFAKTLTWEKNHIALSNQFYVSGVQNYTQNMLIGQVQAVITDSPTLLGLLYYKESNTKIRKAFIEFIVESFRKQNNLNFFLNRKKKYNPIGRNQTEKESDAIGIRMKKLLDKYKVKYIVTDGNVEGKELAYAAIVKKLGKPT
jgi:hypothetical protein